jgi:1-acyl-sn-glycerol-3-phosphate acyltransferase
MKQFVVIGAPHSSNWDILIVLMTSFQLNLDVHWLAKHTLFRFPFGGLMRWLGAIPVNRAVSGDMVRQTVALFAQKDTLVIGLSPEGTRGKTTRWKSGFWHIARTAQVPLVLAFVDTKNKTGGILGEFTLTDDYDGDIERLKLLYKPFRGFRSK